jgi:hypothetical protein
MASVPSSRRTALFVAILAAAALTTASLAAAGALAAGRTHAVTGLSEHRVVERATGRAHPRTQTAPAAAASSAAAGLIFSGAKIGEFWLNQSAPGAITEVADPAGGGGTALKMTVSNHDVAPITPTDGPRAQLLSPATIEPGDEFWWSGSFYLPQSFPSYVPGWLAVAEGAYGPPFEGSPPFALEVANGAIRWQRNDDYNWDIPWEMPIVRGEWVTFMVHQRFATDGFVELWIDGEQVTFFHETEWNPDHEPETDRLQMQTEDHSNDEGPNWVAIQNYRPPGMFNSVSVYQGAMKVGSTRASVAG